MLRFSAKRFCKDIGANITIEFVVMLPLLATWFIGSYLFFDAYKESSRAEKVTTTISDIISRYNTMGDSEMDVLFALLSRALPQSPTGKQLRVTCIEFDGTDYSVNWSESRPTSLPVLNDGTIPLSIMPTIATDDVIMLTETYVPYYPTFEILTMRNTVLRNYKTQRPRFAAPSCITYN